MDDNLIHLTEDNMNNLRLEVQAVKSALQEKFPQNEFIYMLPHLNPDIIIPQEALFETVLGPPPEQNIYGEYGWTLRADRVPYSIFLTKFVGIQLDIDTPFIEELLMWVHKINNSEENVPCRNSQWRHDFFKKRRDLLQNKLGTLLKKEIMDLVLISQHFKSGRLVEETGFLSLCASYVQRCLLPSEEKSDENALVLPSFHELFQLGS